MYKSPHLIGLHTLRLLSLSCFWFIFCSPGLKKQSTQYFSLCEGLAFPKQRFVNDDDIPESTTGISLTLCILGNFTCFLSSANSFSKLTFSKSSFRNTIRVSNSFVQDQDWHDVGPDLGPNWLQGYQQLMKVGPRGVKRVVVTQRTVTLSTHNIWAGTRAREIFESHLVRTFARKRRIYLNNINNRPHPPPTSVVVHSTQYILKLMSFYDLG